ncbi:MAG: DUF2244 domain-containing protein, partial [Acidiferrobacterales bacterium]
MRFCRQPRCYQRCAGSRNADAATGDNSGHMSESKPEFLAVIHPNRSFSGRRTACVFGLYVLISVGIAAGFALDGAWPVAPFM